MHVSPADRALDHALRALQSEEHAEAAARKAASSGEPRDKEDARKDLLGRRAERERLEQALAQQSSSAARDFLTVPFLVCVSGGLPEIDQLGLPHLSLDYHFRKVPRFDRCTTCHQGIDKSLAHRPTQPRYGREQRYLRPF